MSYDWLKEEKSPRILVQAVKQLGVKEFVGKTHNPIILGWAKNLGLERIYTNDEIPWCGLFIAECCRAAGLEVVERPLRANRIGDPNANNSNNWARCNLYTR